MPTSGQIGISQAIAESQNDGAGTAAPHAADFNLSKLAGVSPGQQFAWSWWRGKNLIPALSGYHIADISVNADRFVYVNISLANSTYSWSQNSGNNNSGLQWINLYGMPVPQLQYYTNLQCYIVFEAGSTRTPVTVTQQPNASNGWVVQITWDDNAAGGAAASQYGVYLNASAS
jgi:hypothetical protein